MNLNIDFKKLIAENWLTRKPIVFRNIVSAKHLNKLTFNELKPKLSSKINADIYFHDYKNTGSPQRSNIPNPAMIPAMADMYNKREQSFIYYLFEPDEINEVYMQLRKILDFGFNYRYYSSMISFSNKNSLIPAHIDFIDSLLFQIEGTRVWQVWDNTDLPVDQLRFINDNKTQKVNDFKTTKPLFEVELLPGDAIFLPSLYGHEGFTPQEISVSYSSGWRAFSVYQIMNLIDPEFCLTDCFGCLENNRELYLPISETSKAISNKLYYTEYVYSMLKSTCADYDINKLYEKIELIDFNDPYGRSK